jgi:hypothetical protein
MRKEYLIAFAILALSVAVLTVPISKVDETQGIMYHSQVCIYKNNELVECSHNIVNNGGLNFIRDCIGNGVCGVPTAFKQLAIANCTVTPAAAHTVLCNAANNEWTTCGLANATGTYYNYGTGAWNVSYQWTVTGCGTTPNIYVNGTGLYNATNSGTLFASNTFTTVTLQDADKLNVTWGIWVTSS